MLITSTHNPKVAHLRSLRQRKHRRREGCFLVEGIRIVEEALDRGATVESLAYAPGLLVSERARSLVERVAPERRLALADDVFRSLSDREEPQGIAAAVRIETRSLDEIAPSGDLLVLVAYQFQDPGNLGTLIRSADAAGAAAVVVVEPSADPYDPQSVRATMGSLFALPVIGLGGAQALITWTAGLRELGWPLLSVASSAHGDRLWSEVDYCRPVVLWVGNERAGLPADVRQAADVVVRLPMAGRATSLNAAAAATALAFEIVRQRRAGEPQQPIAPRGQGPA